MTPTGIMLGTNMEPILGVLLLAVGLYGIGYTLDKREWNNGICKESGKPWKYFDSASDGSRGYKDETGNFIWISFNLDKDYNHHGKE